MWENTIEPTLSNTRRHTDVTSVTYAHFTYFSLVDPKKVWNIEKIAIGPGCLLDFLVATVHYVTKNKILIPNCFPPSQNFKIGYVLDNGKVIVHTKY